MKRAGLKAEGLSDLLTMVGMTNQAANLVMQLANPGVGYGVAESRVTSGSAFHRPLKRTRTTAMFLAVATDGTKEDMDYFREVVREVHSHVRSRPGGSPVKYSANSPELQLWVAMCLMRFYLDQWQLLYGDLPEDVRDRMIREAAPLGTALNVRESMWPQSYAEYVDRWNGMVADMTIDEPIREKLEELASLRFVNDAWGPIGKLISSTAGPLYRWLTIASTPADIRHLMGWEWTEKDARLYRAFLVPMRIADAITQPWMGKLFQRVILWDLRWHMKRGKNPLWELRLEPERGVLTENPSMPSCPSGMHRVEAGDAPRS